jgi:hypothetical protein
VDGRVTITVRAPGGRAVGEIVRHPDGTVTAVVIDEAGRDDVERMTAHLRRARPPRSRASCVSDGRRHVV